MEPNKIRRCAVYARLSEMDDTVTKQDERDALYSEGAKSLGCEAVRIYEDWDVRGCFDGFRELLADCQDGAYNAVVLYDLTAGFARWQPYDRKLSESGVTCLEARAGNAFVLEKAKRWREHLRQKREREWQDWVDFNEQPVLFEPDGE